VRQGRRGRVCHRDDPVRAALRALSLDQASPAALLGRLNETMIRHDDTERFATAIVARLQVGERG